jgi:hypothetical protein
VTNKLENLISNLKARNIDACYFESAELCKDRLLELIPNYCSVGIGNSHQSAFRKPFSNLGGGPSTPEYGFALLDRFSFRIGRRCCSMRSTILHLFRTNLCWKTALPSIKGQFKGVAFELIRCVRCKA